MMRLFRPIGCQAMIVVIGLAAACRAQVSNAAPVGGLVRTYRIAGIVVSKADARPLSAARVMLRNTRNRRDFGSTVTAASGKFEFNGIPAGKYSLEGAKRGFISASYDQHEAFSTAIVTAAGVDTENLVLKLAPGAAISGKVLDEAGEPVRHATVTLYTDSHQQGIEEIEVSRHAQTDDLGAYEMISLRPGIYYLSASAKPWYGIHPPSPMSTSASGEIRASEEAVDRSFDVTYPTTYYADVTQADDATPIPVRGGERLQVEIHLNPVPAFRVTFRAPVSEKYGPSFPILEQSAFGGLTSVQTGGVRVDPSGSWEISGIPAGRYNLRIQKGESGLQLTGVDISKDGEEIDVSKAEGLSTINLSAKLLDEPKIATQLDVGLRSGTRLIAAQGQLDAKAQVQFERIPAGRYEVLVWGRNSQVYSISRLSADGADVIGRTLIVKPDSSPSVSIILTSGSVGVQGIVQFAGKPFAGAMVVLVPKNAEGSRDLFRRDQSDLDGTFSLNAVVPGTYTIVAIDNGWDLDWSKPDVIAAYAKHARVVEISNQSEGPVTVEGPVEVQSK